MLLLATPHHISRSRFVLDFFSTDATSKRPNSWHGDGELPKESAFGTSQKSIQRPPIGGDGGWGGNDTDGTSDGGGDEEGTVILFCTDFGLRYGW
jgi:hypothetical protein